MPLRNFTNHKSLPSHSQLLILIPEKDFQNNGTEAVIGRVVD
jgi:hypothetical protein